ncbi:MAG TPA: 50S ribosomal protein L11 methyltransferase [Paenibacillaceae bacterium]
MLWHEVSVLARQEAQEMAAHYLWELGASGVAIEESRPAGGGSGAPYGEWFELPPGDLPEGYAKITGYFAEGTDIADIERRLRQALEELLAFGYDPGRFAVETGSVREEDWAEAWKQYYKPISVTERLTVKPVWEAYDPRPGEIVIGLDPGMAFGTGTHPTTKLCLVALERVVRGGETVIDVGTGSGILAIGAVKLGAARVLALDLDPVAVSSAASNVRLNGLEDRIEVRRSDLLEILKSGENVPPAFRPPVGLVTANLLAEIILRLADDVARVLRPGGVFIASGIYENREDQTARALREAGFEELERLREERWTALIVRKP